MSDRYEFIDAEYADTAADGGPNGVALSVRTCTKCDKCHYARRVSPGHYLIELLSVPKSKDIGRRARSHDHMHVQVAGSVEIGIL